jgi:hypothetical protein
MQKSFASFLQKRRLLFPAPALRRWDESVDSNVFIISIADRAFLRAGQRIRLNWNVYLSEERKSLSIGKRKNFYSPSVMLAETLRAKKKSFLVLF